ncbi:hypothetical protein [Aequorivita echinoideorum]|uniref:Uncharacterized protein n=1 Tax=Aequorivita echinoideorum TaxID=1549647 RepID=A0ABS5S201_9FLAO|nr:hypothetical protein [Aequorivita echinoideorum]MBT0607238.1 hypothetical protein [Aequorivita echinoideorum]
MKENGIAAAIIVGVLAFVGVMWYMFENPALNPRLEEVSYVISRKWNMPVPLDEISGISVVDENNIACVQDEEGIIFIYNLSTSLVEKQINFGKPGDYEALSIVDSTAYVLRSDGVLFEVANYLNPNFSVTQHKTAFTGKNNMESLTLDKKNNRLLLITKNKGPEDDGHKGIYAFNLENKAVETNPIIRISLNDPIFQSKDADDDDEIDPSFYPSDIAVHPTTNNIYILQSNPARLLITDATGKPIELHPLDAEAFPQPEGIDFGAEGAIFISNEGKNGTATILEVEFEEEKNE